MTTIPSSIRAHKKVRFKGYAFTSVKKVLYQIKESGTQNVVEEKVIGLSNHLFECALLFKTTGFFDVSFYIYKEGSQNFALTNEFKVRVKRGLFIF